MSIQRVPIVHQVLSAVPAALAYVAPDGSLPFQNARMAALPAALRDGALAGCTAAREHGSTSVEIVDGDGDEAAIWRFEFHPAADEGALVIIGSDVTATRHMEGQLEDLLAYEQSARALTEQEKVHLAQEKVLLEQVASTDTLTGLMNRRAFDDALERALAHGADAGHSVALLYMDLDGFKPINDVLGHAAGDELLVNVGFRLRGAIRGEDAAARVGGDEFALVLCQLPPDAAQDVAARVAERVLALVCEPVEIAGGAHRVGVSIGIAIAPPGTSDAETLVAAADAAMYEAKRGGGGRTAASARALAHTA